MRKSTPTQNFVPIKNIRDQVVVLDDGSLRGVLMTSSMNFALKSEDEREATLYQFQNFLNTLDFSIQIHIQSRRLNIGPYLNLLNEQYKHQENELLKIQIQEYVEFVKNFTENVNIMTKSFFVVVPYFSFFKSKQSNPLSEMISSKNSASGSETAEETGSFHQQKLQLEHRIGIVEQGLSRTGLKIHRLNDEELTELYHSLFNPDEGGTVKTE